MSELPQLPKTWIAVPLAIAASINPPKGKIEANESQLGHFVPMASVQKEFSGIDVSTTRPLSEVVKGYTTFQEGDVLFAKITPCMENGKIAVIPPLEHRWGFGSTEFHVLRGTELTLPKWIAHFLSQTSLRRSAQRSMTGSAGQLRVPALWLNEQQLPIPPLNEQLRIVAKIEELFSDLDAGVAALKRAKANLKRYRAAVLKAAVEGKLTEAWRAEHPDTEPATKLLERILTERRHKWETDQQAKFAAAGKQPPKNWKEKYKEPKPPETTGLPELPDGWVFAGVDQLITVITSGSRDWTRFYGSGTGTFIMAQNVRKGSLDLSYRQPVNPPANDRDRMRSQVAKNDLLVTIVGANTGDVCRVPRHLPEHYVCQSVALMRPVLPETAEYIEGYFIAEHGAQKHFRRYIYGQGRPHLGFDDLRMTPVALPPLAEQLEIMAEVQQRLSIIDAAETTINRSLLRAARLRQTILKQAFEGKLVPQDPADEPASVLLERIRASQSLQAANGKPNAATGTRGRRAKSTPAKGRVSK